jgi:hypothetical protein
MDERKVPGRSSALAANMGRLRGSRSVADLRADMAAKGYKIGTGTLHRAIKGEAGNRLASLEKIAEFFETTVDQLLQFDGVDETYWPFSEELQQKVLLLNDEEVDHLESVMRAHLRMDETGAGERSAKFDLIHGQHSGTTYPAATEEGARALDDAEVPAPSKHERERNRGPARTKGGGGA